MKLWLGVFTILACFAVYGQFNQPEQSIKQPIVLSNSVAYVPGGKTIYATVVISPATR